MLSDFFPARQVQICTSPKRQLLANDPAVPKELGRLVFDVQYRGLWIACEVTEAHVVLDVSSGPGSPINVAVRDTEFVMEPGSRHEVALAG